MPGDIRFIKVLRSGEQSPCSDQSYVTVLDGIQERMVNKGEALDAYRVKMQEFRQHHPDDHDELINRASGRASALWENGNGISDVLCVDEDEDEVEAMVMGMAAQAAPVAARAMAVEAAAIAAVVEPHGMKKCVCNTMTSCYLKPATPGNTRQVLNAKVRAFVRGGNLPGQGRCNNYCVSKSATTSLTAVDLAKSMAMARFL